MGKYFGPNMVWEVSTKVGPLGDVFRALCTGWEYRCYKKFGPRWRCIHGVDYKKMSKRFNMSMKK